MTEKDRGKPSIGILAYGSLISNPGCEIKRACSCIISDVMTPFHIEFARKSDGRGGAPTLVPVERGGAHVKGRIFVMSLTEQEAANVLYRREINKIGSDRTYDNTKEVTEKRVRVERLTNFAGLDVVLYTRIAATIDPLTAENLADLAIKSVGDPKAGCRRDGISYLIDAKQHGIFTALSPDYEAEILRKTGCGTLEDALAKLRGPAS
jgi:cation transport regulator ChaC